MNRKLEWTVFDTINGGHDVKIRTTREFGQLNNSWNKSALKGTVEIKLALRIETVVGRLVFAVDECIDLPLLGLFPH